MNLVDRNQRIPLRALNDVAAKARQAATPTGSGTDIQMIGAIPIYTPAPERARACTARITGLAVDGGGAPILDDGGNLQYTWTEEERYIDGSGFPAWRDVTFDGARGSVQDGTGIYYGLAREGNGFPAAANEHVIVWAAVENQSTAVGTARGVEHIFYINAACHLFGLTTGSVLTSDATFTVNNITIAEKGFPPTTDATATIIVNNWTGDWSCAASGVKVMFCLLDLTADSGSIGHGNFVQSRCPT